MVMRLIIDTALGYMGIGLAIDADLAASFILARPHTVTTLAVKSIDFLFQSTDYNKKQLNEIVISAGPGAFTSLRTGVSLAKAICMAMDIPLIPVSTFDAMANTIMLAEGNIITAMDGKNNNIYISEYRIKNSIPERIMPDIIFKADKDISSARHYPVHLIGFNVERYSDVLNKLYPKIVSRHKFDAVRMMSALNFIAYERLYDAAPAAAAAYVPVYLREPDVNKRKQPLFIQK